MKYVSAAIIALVGIASAGHTDKIHAAHQHTLTEIKSDQTPSAEDQQAIMANAASLNSLKEDIKCFIDKLLWNDFEGMYIGIKNHMTFRSEIYLPTRQFDDWIAPMWVSMRVSDSWAETPSAVNKTDVEKVLKSIKTTQDYYVRRNHNIKEYAKQYKNEDYYKVIQMYDESI